MTIPLRMHHIPVRDDRGRCSCITCGRPFTIFRDLSGQEYAVIPIPATCTTIGNTKGA